MQLFYEVKPKAHVSRANVLKQCIKGRRSGGGIIWFEFAADLKEIVKICPELGGRNWLPFGYPIERCLLFGNHMVWHQFADIVWGLCLYCIMRHHYEQFSGNSTLFFTFCLILRLNVHYKAPDWGKCYFE